MHCQPYWISIVAEVVIAAKSIAVIFARVNCRESYEIKSCADFRISTSSN